MNMRHTMEELASRGHEVQIHYPFLMCIVFFNTGRGAEERLRGECRNRGTLIVIFTLLIWAESLSRYET